MLREMPRDWKVHVHGFFNSDEMLDTLLKEFQNLYIGVTCAISNAAQHTYYDQRKISGRAQQTHELKDVCDESVGIAQAANSDGGDRLVQPRSKLH